MWPPDTFLGFTTAVLEKDHLSLNNIKRHLQYHSSSSKSSFSVIWMPTFTVSQLFSVRHCRVQQQQQQVWHCDKKLFKVTQKAKREFFHSFVTIDSCWKLKKYNFFYTIPKILSFYKFWLRMKIFQEMFTQRNRSWKAVHHKKIGENRHLTIFLDSTEQIKEFCALKKSKESVIFRWNFYVEKLCN